MKGCDHSPWSGAFISACEAQAKGNIVLSVTTEIEDGEIPETDDPDVSTDQAEQELEVDPDPARVAYTGTDFDVEGLVRRMERGDIVIPTFGEDSVPIDPIETARFQRPFVWSKTQMDRFIESLLLGYPIPGIFLVQQTDRRYLVLDGQQRLRTLAAFYEGIVNKKEFSLQTVATRFKGLTYKKLTNPGRSRLIVRHVA
jgi:hypothetical protein